MNRWAKYILASLAVLVLTALILYVLVLGDNSEKEFYATGGVVYFTQYFMFTAGIISVFFASVAIYQTLTLTCKPAARLFRILASIPVLLLSVILLYSSLLFFCLV